MTASWKRGTEEGRQEKRSTASLVREARKSLPAAPHQQRREGVLILSTSANRAQRCLQHRFTPACAPGISPRMSSFASPVPAGASRRRSRAGQRHGMRKGEGGAEVNAGSSAARRARHAGLNRTRHVGMRNNAQTRPLSSVYAAPVAAARFPAQAPPRQEREMSTVSRGALVAR